MGHSEQNMGLMDTRGLTGVHQGWTVCPQVFGESMQVKLYAPPQSKVDPSIVVMLLIAVVTVTVGGWWSRACER